MINVLYEHIKYEKVQSLINNYEIDDDSKKQLKSYLRKWDKKEKAFRIEYETEGLCIGRKYAKKSLSLQNFKRKIRETLVFDTHTDIDIENCHFQILSQYCKKNNLNCPCIDDYIQNRNIRLQEIINLFDTSRKIAKELFITILYGGNIINYSCENAFDIKKSLPEWVFEMEKEIKLITEYVCTIETNIFNDVKKLKKEKYKNKKSTCLSYTLQVIEDNIITIAVQKLRQLGFIVDTLCFDGLLINTNNFNTDILEELSSYCFDYTGYKVNFTIKPMECFFEIVEKEYDFSDYDFKCTDEYNQLYCGSLVGDTSSETYEKRKAYIELFLCKIQQPEPLYIFQNGIHKKPNILKPPAVKDLLKPITSGFITNMGDISFYDKWTIDLKHRLYRIIDFIPYNIEYPYDNPNDPNIYNVFEGFNPDILGEKLEKEFIMKKIKPFLDLTKELCGGVLEHGKYFINFIAQIFQDPNNKPPICIIIKGKQGVGKNILLDAIGNMLNEVHYITSSRPDDFFGTHAEGYYRKLLVNLNECEGKDTFDLEGKIKSFITEPTISINPKHERPTLIANQARTIITTNKSNPIPIDVKSKDRRYVVYQATDEYLKYSSKFWSDLYNHLRNPQTMQALYQYFMSIDLTNYDWRKKRPITQAYKEMCNLYSPIEALFFEEFVLQNKWESLDIELDQDDYIEISFTDLFNYYQKFCKEHKFLKDETKAVNSRSFKSRLKEIEIPFSQLVKHGGVNYFKFNPFDVYNHIDNRRWINLWKHESDNDTESGEDADDNYFI